MKPLLRLAISVLSTLNLLVFSSAVFAQKTSPQKAAFTTACEKRMQSKSKNAKTICSCIADTIAKKLKDSEFEQITKVYQGEDPVKLKIKDVVLDFEMAASEKCMLP